MHRVRTFARATVVEESRFDAFSQPLSSGGIGSRNFHAQMRYLIIRSPRRIYI